MLGSLLFMTWDTFEKRLLSTDSKVKNFKSPELNLFSSKNVYFNSWTLK